MSPEYLPHFFALAAGVFLVCVAIHHLGCRRWKSALKLGGLGLALAGVSILAGMAATSKTSNTSVPESIRPRPLIPAHRSSPSQRPEEADTMTLVLGGVRVRVPVSDQYDLSADDETFLTVSSDGSGLFVTCRAASATTPSSGSSWPAARISENTILDKAPGIRTLRPDPHTILIEEDGAETLRVHYPEPRTLEVTGRLYLPNGVVRLKEGIVWPPHNFIPPGPLDLTAREAGRIDLEPSGLVRVVSR